MKLRSTHLASALIWILLWANPDGRAQMPGMSAMENTVGFLSSGTSIEPSSTSETSPMAHGALGNWTVMFHANGTLSTIQQSGPRGKDKLISTNWLMPMISRDFGRHSVMFRTMLSLEPATVTKRRYPELFQTGETAYGLPIVDGQHPHDFVMELAGRYQFAFSARTKLFIYGGPIGEPALGPTAFPHRASASENVVAVLGHHQEDSTHISNSVATIGVVNGRLQLEASTFHGREPDENRWNIDGGKPDSFASRLSVSLNDHLSGQFSVGRINNREPLHPTEDTFRTTASLEHHVRFSSGHVASSLIWGRNKNMPGDAAPRIFNAYTFEFTINFRDRNWAWTRLENVDRDRTILLGETSASLSAEEDPIGRIQAFTFGYERDLPFHMKSINAGLGAQITAYGMPSQIRAAYGNHPIAVVAFLRFRPRGNMMEHMRAMHQR